MKHVKESPLPWQHRPIAALQQQLFCIELVQSCTDLIDELQRERGLSQLALSPQAESYAAALREQVRLSTEAEQLLRDKLLQLETWPDVGGASMPDLVRSGLALLHSPGLADLVVMRQRVLLLQCSREQAFEAYCALLAQLLALVATARAALGDAELEQELATLEQLMLAKEYSGQERATGCGLLASGQHDAQGWQYTLRLIEAQHHCAAQFISRARPRARQRLQQTLALETQTELEALRQQLAESPDWSELDPDLCDIWFRTCSRRMNELQQVESGLLQEMRQGLVLKLEQFALPGTLTARAGNGKLMPAAVEAVMRTAAAWLAGDGGGPRLAPGSTAA